MTHLGEELYKKLTWILFSHRNVLVSRGYVEAKPGIHEEDGRSSPSDAQDPVEQKVQSGSEAELGLAIMNGQGSAFGGWRLGRHVDTGPLATSPALGLLLV